MEVRDLIGKVICTDSLEIMRQLEDDEIDIILTDPPYGIGETNEKNLSRGKLAKPRDYGHYEWDLKKLDKEYIDEILRVSKNQIIFGGNYYANWLPPSSCWIVWDKDNGDNDFADCELVWTSFKSAVRKVKYRWNGMLQENMRLKEERYHPTQKPVALIRWILERYTKENDIVLDPFCGSGSILVACKQLNRQFIGIDREPKYCEIARWRLAQEPLRRWLR